MPTIDNERADEKDNEGTQTTRPRILEELSGPLFDLALAARLGAAITEPVSRETTVVVDASEETPQPNHEPSIKVDLRPTREGNSR